MLFADVRDPDDAQACVRCVRADAPGDEGTYGVAMRRIAYMSYGGTPEYVQALRDVVVVLMIEKESAVADLEAMLSVEGVEMVQWGGADYSMSVGKAGQRGVPEIAAAEEKVLRRPWKWASIRAPRSTQPMTPSAFSTWGCGISAWARI